MKNIFIVFLVILLLGGSASAVSTYYWDRTNGVSIAGFTTNWTSCSSSYPQNGYRVTSLGTSASSCANGQLSRSNAGDLFLAIFPTAYTSDTQITGKTNAKFYLRSNSGSATYRFDLGYARSGTFTSLGSVTRTGVSTSGSTYTIDMSTISGTAPAGSNLALRISVTTSGGGRVYMGTNGGTSGSNSGRFYVNETVVTTPPPPPPPPPSSGYNITVSMNRYVVLDDPNAGTAASGFFSPSDVRGGNWNTNYWSGESTTIRGIAAVFDKNGTPQPGTTVNFVLKNPANTIINTISSTTDGTGLAYYSFDLNDRNYWGNWILEANVNVAGTIFRGTSSFVLNFWGCGQCHGSENPGKWGTKYTPKSYYTMGYDFHRSQDKSKHTETMAKGNCVTCHTMYNGIDINRGYNDNTPTINNENEYSPDWHNGKVKCQDCHAGSNISTTPQRKNPEIAGCYDTAGCHPKKNINVTGVLTTTGYAVGVNYRTNYSFIPNNIAKAHTDPGITCIACHDAGHKITKPYNASITSNSFTESEQCWTCHTNRSTTHYKDSSCVNCHSQNAHNIAKGGGPDCLSCHNFTGGNAQHKVDGNAMKSGIHANLNKNSTAGAGISVENKKCWGCHQSDGKQPTGMGDIYRNPYKCYDCHNATKPYANVSNALTVSEHFKNGTDIKAATSESSNSTSCIKCHNLTEMKVTYTDTEFTAFSLPSHYGKNRTDIRTNGNSNCLYCHRNLTTAFAVAMNDTNNRNISNHSMRYSSSNPDCSQCHSSGWIHNATLTKPNITLPNSTYCLSCHGLNTTTGRTNYSGAVTGVKSKHNNSVNCTECHLKNSSDIHPAKYLQSNGNFNTSNSTGANCATCHQGSSVDANLSKRPQKISSPLHHSDNPQNGSIWGSYWTSPIEACLYCHNDTKHNATPLGRPLIWNSSYVMNTFIGSGTNCADCHYKGDNNYANMSLAFASAGLLKPPEITNGSWMGKPDYYNHSFATYSDSQCKSCHDTSGSSQTVGELLHNVSVGKAGAADCNSCHDIGGSAPAHVNITDMNSSDALHSGLNLGAYSTVDPVNKKCWACHGNGSQPSGHPTNYRTPFVCIDCHIQSASQNLNFTPSVVPNVSNHYWNGTNISTTASSCYQCHNRSGMLLSTIDPDTGTVYGGINGGIMSPSHYGKKRTDLAALAGTNGYCNNCHNTTTNNATFYVSDYNNSIKNHSVSANTPLCSTCHNSGRLHDVQLLKPVSNDNLCKTCHGIGGSSLLRNKTEHNNTLYCTECHANATDGRIAGKDIHGIKFIQKDNTFSQDRTNAADCTTCHQLTVADNSLGTFIPPKVNSPLHHSTNLSNGSIWGSYWTTPIGACLYCHNDTKHNATPLGRPLNWNSSYVMNTTIGSGTNCADCHYKGDSNYDAMNLTFTSAGLSIPPEITNVTSWNGTSSGYYNHSLRNYTDSECKGCHDTSASTTVGQLLHNVNVGQAGGKDCVGCHDLGASAPVHVNVTALNDSTAIHKKLNIGATTITIGMDSNNKRCWSCHTNYSLASNGVNENELPESGHPDSYKDPRACVDCHRNDSIYNMSAPQVYAHQPDAVSMLAGINKSINTTFNCVMCHNNSKLDEIQLNGSGAITQEGTISHYATRKNLITRNGANLDQSYCTDCHQDLTNGNKYGLYETKKNHDAVTCFGCHRNGNSANSLHSRNLLKPVFYNNSLNDNYCSVSCHAIAINNSWGAPHGNSTSKVTCTNCHMNYTAFVTAMTNNSPGHRNAGTNYHSINSTDGLAPGNRSLSLQPDYNRSRCTVCHDGAVNHNVGSDCINCHEGSDFARNVLNVGFLRPVYHSENITRGGGPNCLNCHNTTSPGGTLHRVNGSAIANGIHANLNAEAVNDATVFAENKKCWACHQSDGKQPRDMGDRYQNPYKCTDCHNDTSKPYANVSGALNVSEHFVNGTDIKAVKFAPDNLSSCLFCHNKSEMKVDYQENDIYNSTVSLISHYGKKRTDLLVSTNSTNCTYCHQNPTSSNNFSDAFVDDNNKNITHNEGNDCSVCHGFGRIHNSTLTRGGGPDCLTCHNNSGSATHRIDGGAVALGIHANLNSGATSDVPAENKKCWACHQSDGTQPSGMGDRYKNPYKCTDCHIPGAGQNMNFDPNTTLLNVTNHFVNGTNITAVKNAADNLSSCIFCHNKTEMKVDYVEDDGIFSNVSLISHYGKTRGDLLSGGNSTNCTYCHQNPPVTNNFTDSFIEINNTNITHNSGALCSDCHGFGRLHNSTLTGGSCIGCHGEGATGSHKNNITSLDLGAHVNLSSMRGEGGEGVMDVEDCRTCHFGNPHIGVSKANTYYCENCHRNNTASNKWGINATKQITNFQHGVINTRNDCAWCHTANYSTQRRTKNYHVGDPNGTVSNPGWDLNHGSPTTTCFDCHSDHNGQDEPFHAPGMYRGRSGHGYAQNDCGGCHGFTNGIYNSHLVNPSSSISYSIITSVSAPDNVTLGEPINFSLNACYARSGDRACENFIQLELAQYRLLNTSRIEMVINWTYMNATDGKFDSFVENANATINTSALPRGNYTLELRAMAGAPKSIGGIPYYPLNGRMSDLWPEYIEVR